MHVQDSQTTGGQLQPTEAPTYVHDIHLKWQAEEARVLELAHRVGLLAAFQQLIAENDAQIRRARLDNGRELAIARTAIHTALVRYWAAEQIEYGKPWAVVALGGTGRGEMSPASDNDFAFLFEDAIEGNAFLLKLQKQVLHSNDFKRRFGFTCLALPFCLDDLPYLAGKQLNSFLDMRAVHDPYGLAARFRERIRATYDSFLHFVHVREFWKGHWSRVAEEPQRLDRFEIKNESLRLFLAGCWTLAGKDFVHCHEIYQSLDGHDLEAYDFLMRIRAFVNLRHAGDGLAGGGGNHGEDVLRFDDFLAFGDLGGEHADERARFELANEVRARLISARRRVASFATGVIEHELKAGRPLAVANPIVYGVGGLRHTTATICESAKDKSRAAMALLHAAQRYMLPIDASELRTTFRNAGDLLDREDAGRPLHERFSSGVSGIPLSEYYVPYVRECGFSERTQRIVEFLVANRRAFKEQVEAGLNDARQVEQFAERCGEERLLRALFVFTCADRAEWESPDAEPARWFNARELYAKTLAYFRPATDPTCYLHSAGYSPEELRVLKDFGEDFFGGVYRQYANHFGAHLVRLAESLEVQRPRVSLLRQGAATIIGVAARDYRGLAATISGAIWRQGIEIRQAHFFSASQFGLALDFFHLVPREDPLPPGLVRFIEEAIERRLYIADEDEANLPNVSGEASMQEWRPGLHCLRFESSSEAKGLIYLLTYRIYRYLRGSIFGLTAIKARQKSFVSVYHSLPAGTTLEQARAIVAERF